MGEAGGETIDVCAIDEVEEGGALRVETRGLTLAVFKIDGHVFVLDDHCTHGPGSLSEGWLKGHEIECHFHQGCFDVRTGEVTSPPPMIPVRTYRAVLDGGRVLIEGAPQPAGA